MPITSDGNKCSNWKDLVEAIAQELQVAAILHNFLTANTYQDAETVASRKIQMDCFI